MTDPAELATTLTGTRRRGWAADPGGYEPGVGGLAVPVRSGGGLTVAALGVGAPAELLFHADGRTRHGPARRADRGRRRDRGRAGGAGMSSRGVPPGERVVAAIDQGTTSTRCLLFTHSGRMVAVAQREHRQYYPRPGLAEHDASEIWRAVSHVVPAALRRAGLTPDNVAALGIANQRETTIVWNRHTGLPLARAITWQDTRTDQIVSHLDPELSSRVSGLAPATYFAGPRLQWLLDHVPGARDGAEAGDVLFGTMESWLIWQLTGGPAGGRHVSDVTNASRTMLMDLRTLQWSTELCAALRVPERMLPEIVPNAEVYGTCAGLLPGVPVAGALGDQQAALVGQTCFAPGEVKCTYGTGAFLLKNTGSRIAGADTGLIPTVGYLLGDRPVYAMEGSIAMTGSLVQWFRDALGMISTAARIESLALTVADNGGCYVVPAFSGLYAPRWHPDARGVIVGLTSFIERGHLARAVLEATAWQTREVVDAMNARLRSAGHPPEGGRRDDGQPPAHAVLGRRTGPDRRAPARVRGGLARRGLRRGPGRRVLAGHGGAAPQLAPRRRMGAHHGPGRAQARTHELAARGGAEHGVGVAGELIGLPLGAAPRIRITTRVFGRHNVRFARYSRGRPAGGAGGHARRFA